jgi:hypothetical protein
MNVAFMLFDGENSRLRGITSNTSRIHRIGGKEPYGAVLLLREERIRRASLS